MTFRPRHFTPRSTQPEFDRQLRAAVEEQSNRSSVAAVAKRDQTGADQDARFRGFVGRRRITGQPGRPPAGTGGTGSGEGISHEAFAALSADDQRAYLNMSGDERAAFRARNGSQA